MLVFSGPHGLGDAGPGKWAHSRWSIDLRKQLKIAQTQHLNNFTHFCLGEVNNIYGTR